MVTVLSASGFDALGVVSLASSEEPSKTNLSTTFLLLNPSTVVVPCTVKSPVTIKPSAIEIVVESELDKVVPLICISDDCKALVLILQKNLNLLCVLLHLFHHNSYKITRLIFCKTINITTTKSCFYAFLLPYQSPIHL